MIGSFWNLCRACPSMPVDKLHSEYRSTYRWHEYTGPRQEVIRRPPQPVQTESAATKNVVTGTSSSSFLHAEHVHFTQSANSHQRKGLATVEPAIPRRKKHPELAYRTHEFLTMSEVGESDISLDATVMFERARSEERGRVRSHVSRRSKSEGPPRSHINVDHELSPGSIQLRFLKVTCSPPLGRAVRSDSDPYETYNNEMAITTPAPPTNAIGKCVSTEYRLQFAWPKDGQERSSRTEDLHIAAGNGPPRKSLSMGAIRSTGNPVPVHQKRVDNGQHEDGPSELEPLVKSDYLDGSAEFDTEEEKIRNEMSSKEDKQRKRKEFKTEYKKKFRPFSTYDYVEGKFQKKKDLETEPLAIVLPELPKDDSWYREVIELRKKAGEYKHRGWGTELVPQHIAELYNKQMMLWDQVSRRSSLSALSLASTTPRSVSKEEKDKENNKKSSPLKSSASRTHVVKPSTFEKILDSERKQMDKEEIKKEIFRARRDFLIRHHLERTTGAGDGALLTSPTREKLEPVLPRQKEDDVCRSPKKASPKSSPRSVRSQSVGPALSGHRSPKRQIRGPSSAPSSVVSQPLKTQLNGPVTVEKRPRPTAGVGSVKDGVASTQQPPRPCVDTPSLVTNVPSRMKSSSGPVPLSHNSSVKSKLFSGKLNDGTKGASLKGDQKKTSFSRESSADVSDNKQEEKTIDSSTASQSEDIEPALVKSPPEPTRVKSPEQIIMRSPEPVNWTVPLDTGKTFTVTQNVREGELSNRPHSEIKAWTPPSAPPPAPQSAPPQLLEQASPHVSASPEGSGCKSPEFPAECVPQDTKVISMADITSEHERKPGPTKESSATPTCESSVAGTTLKCLDDPSFASCSDQPVTKPPQSSIYQVQGPYHVLEAPVVTHEPLSKPPLVSPSSGRSLATDVLEKAMTRFDNFWGKGKDSNDNGGKL